jgi:AraC-like DNA-binding protein
MNDISHQNSTNLVTNYYKPDAGIQWLVRYFETIKSDFISVGMTDNFIPRPDVAIVFNFGAIPKVLMPEVFELKPLFIASIANKPLQLMINGNLDSFIAICNASILSKFLNIDLLSSPYPITQTPDTLNGLWELLAAKRDNIERIEVFSEFINSFSREVYIFDNIDYIYLNILDNCLHKPLHEMIDNACCSVSSLQRKFLKRTGVSMKKLTRIARVNAIFNKMVKSNNFDYNSFLSDSNYYDQAHFMKDFRELTGLNPRQFFRNQNDLLKTISGVNETI